MSELASLLELLGQESTLKIVEAHGGTRVKVPKDSATPHHLRELLGDAGYAVLWQYFGGSELVVPMARKWRFEIYNAREMKPKEIARKTGSTEDAVYRHLRNLAEGKSAPFSAGKFFRRGSSDRQMGFNFDNDNVPQDGRR
jgi:hypothetical protein